MRRRKKKERIINAKNAVGIFIVVMMLASGVGFILNMNNGSANANEYKGHLFKSDASGAWWTEVGGKTYRFSYHPSVVDYLNVSSDIIGRLKNAEIIYITYDPKDRYITDIENLRFNLESDLNNYFGIIPETGVTEITDEYAGFTKIDCQDGTANAPVLKFETGSEIGFDYSGNCITVTSDESYGFNIARDRLILGMLGVIDDSPN